MLVPLATAIDLFAGGYKNAFFLPEMATVAIKTKHLLYGAVYRVIGFKNKFYSKQI